MLLYFFDSVAECSLVRSPLKPSQPVSSREKELEASFGKREDMGEFLKTVILYWSTWLGLLLILQRCFE